MQSSPNSALFAFPTSGQTEAYLPFVKWWVNYLNIVLKLTDEFEKVEEVSPKSFWAIEPACENLFFASNAMTILNMTKSKRVYFIGSDLIGTMETNIRMAHCIALDPVLIIPKNQSESICVHDLNRLSKYCEVVEIDDLIKGFEKGGVDFTDKAKELSR